MAITFTFQDAKYLCELEGNFVNASENLFVYVCTWLNTFLSAI